MNSTKYRHFGRLVQLLTLCITTAFLLISCQKNIQNNTSVYREKIQILTEQLIYGEEEVRIKALDRLTKMGAKVRYSAINELVKVLDNNPEIFPRMDNEKNPSLLKEILQLPFDQNTPIKKKEYVEVRMMHLRILNSLLKVCMHYRIYYEMVEILYQKYLYGTLWSQESLAIYKDKSAAEEFTHARNAAVANLHLLLNITADDRTKEFIKKCLEQIE